MESDAIRKLHVKLCAEKVVARSELNGILRVHSRIGNRCRCNMRCLGSAAILAASTGPALRGSG